MILFESTKFGNNTNLTDAVEAAMSPTIQNAQQNIIDQKLVCGNDTGIGVLRRQAAGGLTSKNKERKVYNKRMED